MTAPPSPDELPEPPAAQPPHSAQEDWQQVAPFLDEILNAARPYRGAIEACAEEATRHSQKQRLLQIAHDLSENRQADEVFNFGHDMDPSHIEALQWNTSNRRDRHVQEHSPRFSSPSNPTADADRAVWNTIAYPGFTLLAVLLLALMMWSAIIPEFQVLFDDFELPLPPPTEMVLAMRPFIVAANILCIAAIVTWALRRWIFHQSFRRWLSFKVPFFGYIYRNAAYGKHCHLVSILLEAGAPLAPAMRVASRGTLPEQAAKAVSQLVDSRSPIAPPRSARFPNRMFLTMQSTLNDQDKGAVFRELSRDLCARANHPGSDFLQPLMVFLVGLMIGFVIISLFMPLVSLVTNLAG